MNNSDLIYRLRKRAEIRRQIPHRKSVIMGEPDRISDLLEEAADALEAALATTKLQSGWDKWQNQKRGCSVCGVGADGKVMGYVCTRMDCPTKITCGVNV